MKLILFFSLLFLSVSCGSSNRKQQLDRLSDMIEKVDSLKHVLEQNKTDSIVELQLAANSIMQRIKKDYKPKKVDMNFGRKVDEFKELQMLFVKEKEENKRTLAGEYGLVFSALDEEKRTLLTLKSDIENERGDNEKYDEFINFEREKLNTIEGLLNHYIMRKNKYLPRFRKSMNELIEFMDNWNKNSTKTN